MSARKLPREGWLAIHILVYWNAVLAKCLSAFTEGHLDNLWKKHGNLGSRSGRVALELWKKQQHKMSLVQIIDSLMEKLIVNQNYWMRQNLWAGSTPIFEVQKYFEPISATVFHPCSFWNVHSCTAAVLPIKFFEIWKTRHHVGVLLKMHGTL